MWAYLNSQFVREEDAHISILDHGFLYGDGVYETLRTYEGKFFMLDRHLARLRRSATAIGLHVPMSDSDWASILHEALQRNGLVDAWLRITISRGEGEPGLDPNLCKHPTLVVISRPFRPFQEALYHEGVRVALVSVRRNLPAAHPPRIKSLSFLNNILAKHEAMRSSAFDGLMLNADGDLTECTTSNIFLVKEGRLCTPSFDCGILGGITREVVLQLAQEYGMACEEGRYKPDEAFHADECFLTNTSMELMPVREIDQTMIGNGSPGPLTRRLHGLFHANLPRFLSDG